MLEIAPLANFVKRAIDTKDERLILITAREMEMAKSFEQWKKMPEMPDNEAIADATTASGYDLAQSIYDALMAETSHDGHPFTSGDEDLHSVTLDGSFDLVATARKLRSLLKAEMLALLETDEAEAREPEIEVTAEMALAGGRILADVSDLGRLADIVATRVFLEMLASR